MKKILPIILLAFLYTDISRAQECRDFKPDEQKLYIRLLQVFDESVKNKFDAQEWNVQLKNTSDDNVTVGQKMLPERPFAVCGFERLHMNMLFPWWKKLQDSSDSYDSQINSIAGTILNGPADPKTLGPLQKRMHELHYKQGNLMNQYGAEIVGEFNAPFLTISSPQSGPSPVSCKKITVPGAAIAYVLKYHDDDGGDRFQAVIGLGKWTDNIKNYLFDRELYNYYHFAHHYPTTVIENLTFTVTSGRMQDVMDITNKIDWTKMNQALTN